MDPALTPKRRLRSRLSALKTERNKGWVPHWRELSDFILPRKSRFLPSDKTTAGDKKHNNIINGTATWAARVLSSGMMAGITSPARPWFRLTTPDPELAEFGAVKEWLHVVEQRIRTVFARSNIYNGLHQVYESLGTFGTAAMIVDSDQEDVLRAYVLPIGRYCLANSARLRVDSLYDELTMTVAQLVEQFGVEKVSSKVKSQYDRGEYDASVEVVHIIEPNRKRDPKRADYGGMPWKSCWFEADSSDEKYLREGGYHEFPVMAPRWSITGEDAYGSSPAMDILGDARALQTLERRKGQVVDKIVNPPMVGPAALRNQRVSMLPGDVNYIDGLASGYKLEPAIVVNPAAITVIEAACREHEARTKTGYYADLWLMLTEGAGGDMTAREVAERHEEKMMQLGPVMERLEDELLDPLIDRTFWEILRTGGFPPPPKELQGKDIRVEYLSIMAQAQKMLGITGVERLASFTGNLAAVKPEVLDKLDMDQMVDEYANMLGVPPKLVRTDDAVEAIRAQRAQAAQQQAQMEQAAQAVQGAQVLSQTDMGGDNALTRMIGGLGGAAASGAGVN